MRAAGKLFALGMRQILRDGMLLVLLPAPFLMGAALRVLIPLAGSVFFCLEPWYPLSDALLLSMTPMLVAMASAFLMLDERDEGIGCYYAITPAGGQTYLMARLAWPLLWAFACAFLVQRIFGLSTLAIPIVLAAGLIGTLQGLAVAMLLVAFAGNKVEGIALSKLAGIFSLGLPAAWFLSGPARYSVAFLPSFWMGELMKRASLDPISCLAGLLSSLIFVVVLFRLFLRRTRL